MRAPIDWIRQYVDLPDAVTTDEIVAAYTRIGLEVEDVHRVPPTDGPLLVGRVLAIEELTGFKKPIRFCQVDLGPGHGPDGGDGPRGIICGAQNFVVDDRVIVAPPGTVLPGGFTISARRTYDHISDGMICSARELGIGEDHDGIVVLDRDAPVGSDARTLIGADDAVIEFAITPDRGYTLSIRGLARELAAAFEVPFTDPAQVPLRAAAAGRPVTIIDTERCARFVAVDIDGIDPAAPSPWALRRRLSAAGIRAISLTVDVTNYVMVELGHPLHAFDADLLDGGIVVRRAYRGETLRTLDDVERSLSDDDVVVADQSRAVSLAGVMGGAETEISSATTTVVIEAASWDPPSVSRTVRRHRLPSEASRRYERAVDPALSAIAAERAAALLVEHGGGRLGGRTDAGGAPRREPILLPTGAARRLAGRDYDRAEIIHRLEQIGADVRAGDDGYHVIPPSWRPDLTRPADLVEEIARLAGYDTIEPILPTAPAGTGLTPSQRRRRRLADHLAAAGLTQVLSFPFTGESDLDRLGLTADDPRRRALRVANPLETDRPLMATTLLPGLIATAVRNLARGSKDLAIFEIGQVVLPDAQLPAAPVLPVDRAPAPEERRRLWEAVPPQPVHLAIVLTGAWEHRGWWGPARQADTIDILSLARRIGQICAAPVELVAAERAPWHPGRCAAVTVDGRVVGYAGQLHPRVVERFDLPAGALALELDVDALPAPLPPVPPAVSPYPPVLQDVALVVDGTVTAAAVTRALHDGGGELLERVRLFDVYTGDQIGAGQKSLAFALTVRAPDRTLTAEQAGQVRDAAVAEAGARTGAVLRT